MEDEPLRALLEIYVEQGSVTPQPGYNKILHWLPNLGRSCFQGLLLLLRNSKKLVIWLLLRLLERGRMQHPVVSVGRSQNPTTCVRLLSWIEVDSDENFKGFSRVLLFRKQSMFGSCSVFFFFFFYFYVSMRMMD